MSAKVARWWLLMCCFASFQTCSILDRESFIAGRLPAPILSEGDVLGSVLFSGTKDNLSSDEVKSKLAQVTANFLGRHMES